MTSRGILLGLSSWSCSHEVKGLCDKVGGALCRPGMRGCVLHGKVTFQDGKVPDPEWPAGASPVRRRPKGEGEGEGGGEG